jgi:hypothetical protein
MARIMAPSAQGQETKSMFPIFLFPVADSKQLIIHAYGLKVSNIFWLILEIENLDI